jgi:mannose-6-phosphate isomerase-like protein (cupin superfamily)
MKGYKDNIEKLTLENEKFRKVLYTVKNCQLVLMELKPKEEIGEEVHDDTDQFFRVEKGTGQAVVNAATYMLEDGDSLIVPAGVTHNVINTSADEPLKLYTIYCPPHHRDGTVHETRDQAMADDEHYDGKNTE